MAQTGAIFNSLIFGGVDSANYGIYITGEAVYNAPERAVELLNIPGRNGAFAIDQGYWENIEVTYPAGVFGDASTDFATAIRNFRNAIVSQIGYQRLTDTYNPNEYRMAMYVAGLEVEPVNNNAAGEFELVFNCKPQRWLTSGENKITLGGANPTQTVTGDVVTFNNDSGVVSISSVEVAIEPVQSGTGAASPTNIRPISGWDDVIITVADDHDNPTETNTYTINLSGDAGTVYGGTLNTSTGLLTVTKAYVDLGLATWQKYSGTANVFLTNGIPKKVGQFNIICTNYRTSSVESVSSMPNQSIKGHGSTQNVYIKDSNFATAWSNGDVATFKSAMSGVYIVYELNAQQTYNLTPKDIETILGNNDVWANAGDVTVTYGDDSNKVFNSTQYDANPLLEVTGYGNIGFNGYNIEVKNETYGNVELLPSSGGVNTYQLDTSVFNSGDTIYIGETVFQWFFIPRNYPTSYWTSYTLSDFGIGTTSVVSQQTGNKVVCKTVYSADSFASNANYAEATICTVSVDMNDGTTKSFQIACSIFYDHTDGTISFAIADVNASDFFLYEDAKSGAVTVNSTKSVISGTIYIDCDLGEAYSLNNGVATGLNAYVDIGSDLPKMAPGSNKVTFDNTVTDLKITPRWWQL